MARLSLIILFFYFSSAVFCMDGQEQEDEVQNPLEALETCVVQMRWEVIAYFRALSFNQREKRLADDLARNVEQWIVHCKSQLAMLSDADADVGSFWAAALQKTEKEFMKIRCKSPYSLASQQVCEEATGTQH